MADYWKSQPKKFCKYCKCWIADNKPSVEFHERGKNHKENVALKIEEIKKKSIDKAKQDDRMSKEFAAMEAAAQKAYEEDLKRLGIEPAPQSQPQTQSQPQPQPPTQTQPQVQSQPPRKEKKVKSAGKASRQPPPVSESDSWVEGQSEDGVTYYYNTLTGESKWHKPDDIQEGQNKSPWVEAVSPEGYTYYYHSESGESSWERPADLPAGSDSGASEATEGQDDASPAPTPVPSSGGEEGYSTDKVTEEKEGGGDESKQDDLPKKQEEENSEKEGAGENGGGDEDKEEGDEKKKGEEGGEVAATQPEDKMEAPVPAKKPRRTNPYGAWEQIQEEEDPYEKVDLQLPQIEGGAASAPPPTVLPPEPKAKFKERTITSLGEEGGSTSFRKRKAENGKSRSLRQRGKDD